MKTWERVTVLFANGAHQLSPADELSFADLLRANRMPPSMFQAYEVPGDGSLRPVPITHTLAQIPEQNTVILQCMRNTDAELLPRTLNVQAHSLDPVAAMYDLRYSEKNPEHRVHLLDDEQLREIVFAKIAAFLREYGVTLPLVAGISGGGDSSSIVRGLDRFVRTNALRPDQVLCFTVVLDPLWRGSAAHRARDLCEGYGFVHRVLFPEDIASLLGMSATPEALWRQVRDTYGADASHFFGTWLLNMVGRALNREIGGTSLLMGYNREDVMAELLFCLMNGRRPLPYPKRRTGDVDCLMPVWDVPKVLLDSCYPRLSEVNYTERIDTTAPRRSSIYYQAHALDAIVPQMSVSLLTGVRDLMESLKGWEVLEAIDGTPLLTTGRGDPKALKALVNLLARYFPDWTAEEDHQQ
ncbi:hypothetical protein SAMN05421803_11196 [Nocardiopsis flavescens]|uniref:tRNA(Ile)-lysidine synthase TilS/MesJ n=1 Tax=Nocardiopsis flavescens TaxID=758803 RepID=A0A1M6N7U9_9ACTN|nr:hypothetical protein [Nocardiopsis flavescens]SHJ91616.1 hypothetical protein SAMN05421803_11196 [Nocardiopsis flavescens]